VGAGWTLRPIIDQPTPRDLRGSVALVTFWETPRGRFIRPNPNLSIAPTMNQKQPDSDDAEQPYSQHRGVPKYPAVGGYIEERQKNTDATNTPGYWAKMAGTARTWLEDSIVSIGYTFLIVGGYTLNPQFEIESSQTVAGVLAFFSLPILAYSYRKHNEEYFSVFRTYTTIILVLSPLLAIGRASPAILVRYVGVQMYAVLIPLVLAAVGKSYSAIRFISRV
jgi:hypothetical protein